MKVSRIEPGYISDTPAVIALGNFDGVHLGHQKLLQCGREQAKLLQVKLSVLLFDPHPMKMLYPGRKLNILTGFQQRLQLFEELGVDEVFLLAFTPELAKTPPSKFVREILLKLGAVHVVVGFNYSFGYQGKGNPVDLQEYGRTDHFGVSVVQAQKINNMIVSSTAIRTYLLNGEVDLAKEMMGRSPRITGKVVAGDQRGRTLGYPTANIQVEEDLLIPKNGVYAVSADIGGRQYGGMMNIGLRPTFLQSKERSVEVHLLDYKGDLYGRQLTVNLEARLRQEKKFKGSEEIVDQLKKDEQQARAVLNK